MMDDAVLVNSKISVRTQDRTGRSTVAVQTEPPRYATITSPL